jgi:small conductance mechanosensitive channel
VVARTEEQRIAQMASFSPWLITVLPQVVAAIILILVGLWLARWVERVVINFLDHHQVLDLTFRGVITSLVRYSILLLAVTAALQQIGVQTTSILAAVGAILVAVGLALQGTLSNLAAGVMLLWLRPFRVGDAIETTSVVGTITNVGLFATEILRTDGVYVFAPNSDLWSKPLSNLSRMPSRLIEIKLSIKKGGDIEVARQRLLQTATAEASVHRTPPPTVVVSTVTETAVVLSLNAWVDAAHFRQTCYKLAERAAGALADL